MDQGEGVRLLRNDIPQGNWVELRLHNRVPPKNLPLGFGDGATVTAWVGGVPLRRTIGSASYLSQDSHRVHIGLGTATKVDRLEVRWLCGGKETWTNLAVNQIWDIIQGDPQARPFTSPTDQRDATNVAQAMVPTSSASGSLDKATLAQFWTKQHAAMDAMKREQNCAKAVPLFREALAMNAQHEDSHYYLANCLATLGDISEAVAELDALARINPQNHRAFQRKGELLAASATSRTQLSSARESLETALHLNSEETGTLVLLGQVALAEGDLTGADKNFIHACQANTHAANAWFLRGYVAWRRSDLRQSAAMLVSARNARGPDFKPTGAVLEGDVRHLMYNESGFLNIFERQWDGSPDPARAFAQLDTYLRHLR